MKTGSSERNSFAYFSFHYLTVLYQWPIFMCVMWPSHYWHLAAIWYTSSQLFSLPQASRPAVQSVSKPAGVLFSPSACQSACFSVCQKGSRRSVQSVGKPIGQLFSLPASQPACCSVCQQTRRRAVQSVSKPVGQMYSLPAVHSVCGSVCQQAVSLYSIGYITVLKHTLQWEVVWQLGVNTTRSAVWAVCRSRTNSRLLAFSSRS
jgi:hypothetical protein